MVASRYRTPLTILSLLIFLASNPATANHPAAGCLRLGADESLGENLKTFTTLFDTLYAHAGFCAISIPMAPKRIEQLLEAGELDGDWFRPGDYAAERSARMLAIPQPVFGLEARLIWLTSDNFSGKPEDMKGLTVGHQAGFRWLETHLPQMGAKTFVVPGSSHVWDLLARGRIDIFATSGMHEEAILAQLGDRRPMVKSTLWATVSFFHLVHPRHQDKVPKLDKAMRTMIISGEMAKFITMHGLQPAKALAD